VVTASKPKSCRYHNIVRHEASRNFRNIKRKYLKANINEFAANSKNKNIIDLGMDINDTNGNHLRTNTVKNEKGGVVANPNRGFVMWMDHFSELLNAPGLMMLGRIK
jgi:hypothetical protein